MAITTKSSMSVKRNCAFTLSQTLSRVEGSERSAPEGTRSINVNLCRIFIKFDL